MQTVLIQQAARAYGVPVEVLTAAFMLTPVVEFTAEDLKSWKFKGDPSTPEHQAYLLARKLADLRPLHGDEVTWLAAYAGSRGLARRAWWKHHPNMVVRWLGRRVYG